MAILGVDELSEDDRAIVSRARKIERFFSQPFFVAEQFTGKKGVYTKIAETLKSFEEITDGRADDLTFRDSIDCADHLPVPTTQAKGPHHRPPLVSLSPCPLVSPSHPVTDLLLSPRPLIPSPRAFISLPLGRGAVSNSGNIRIHRGTPDGKGKGWAMGLTGASARRSDSCHQRTFKAEALERRWMLSGVTFITHGFLLDNNDNEFPEWIKGMAHAVAAEVATHTSDPSDSSTDIAQFRLKITDPFVGAPRVESWAYDGNFNTAGRPSASDFDLRHSASGEAVVMLDWSRGAGLNLGIAEMSTGTVARLVADYLLNPEGLGRLGRQIVESPLHLIGHSRGASMVGALADELGERGVWVNHATFLDTHPILGDYENDLTGPFDISENIIFADSYWRPGYGGLDGPNGERVIGAYNVELDNSKLEGAGYDNWDLSDQHSDVHLWYHGTIDEDGTINNADPGSGGEFNPDTYEWYEGSDSEGHHRGPRWTTGFSFSGIDGSQREASGIARRFGGQGDRNRISTRSGIQWPNLGMLTTDLTPNTLIRMGSDVPVTFRYQFYDATPTDTPAVIEWFLDTDRNPYTSGATSLIPIDSDDAPLSTTAPGTGAGISDTRSIRVTTPAAGVTNTRDYFLYGKISGNGYTRYSYVSIPVRFFADVSDTTRPQVQIATANDITAAGGTGYTFSVRYSDNIAVDVSSFGASDIRVIGPTGASASATFYSRDFDTDGSPRAATYQIIPPGGTWDVADNGIYTVAMQPNQVSDTSGNFVPSGPIGTFSVSIGAAHGPEISVRRLGTSVTNGQADPVDFGIVLQGGAGAPITFIVRNEGDESLTFGPVTVPPGYRVPNQPSAVVLPGGESHFDVVLESASPGRKGGSVSFSTNDADESDFAFPVTGNVVLPPQPGPEVTVRWSGGDIRDGQPAPIDFGTTPANRSVVIPFTLRNDGTELLSFGPITAEGQGFSTPVTIGNLSPGSEFHFDVTLSTAVIGTKVGRVRIPNNDLDEDLFEFSVRGSITPDDRPVASVLDFTALEGDNGNTRVNFNIGLSRPLTAFARIDYVVYAEGAAHPATLDLDYRVLGGYVNLLPGDLAVIPIELIGDSQREGDEQFYVRLENAVGLILGRTIATGTITDDEWPKVKIADVTPDWRNTPVELVTIAFNYPVIGFDAGDLSLTHDGGANLLTPEQTLSSSDGGQTWTLQNLAPLSGSIGRYVLTLDAVGSGIVDQIGQSLQSGDSEPWLLYAPGTPVQLAGGLLHPRDLALDSGEVYFDEYDTRNQDAFLRKIPSYESSVVRLLGGNWGPGSSFHAFQVVDDYVYGSYGWDLSFSIYRTPKNGGPRTDLTPPQLERGGRFAGVEGDRAYYRSAESNAIISMALDGSSRFRLPPAGVLGAKVDGSMMYFVDYNNYLKRFDLTTGVTTSMQDFGSGLDGAFFINGPNIYLNIAGDILAVPKFGGPVITLVDGEVATAFASDGAFVYYREAAAVRRVPVGGGPSDLIAEVVGGDITGIAVDAKRVYWAVSAEPGSGGIYMIDKPPATETIAPSAEILPVSPDPHIGPVESLTIRFSEPVFGFDETDLRLTLNGRSYDLLSPLQVLTAGPDGTNRTFILSGLGGVTHRPGTYLLALDARKSDVTDAAGNHLSGSVAEGWWTGPMPMAYRITDLGDLPGGDVFSDAYSINSLGEVVGTSATDSGNSAFLWSPRTGMRNLGSIGSGPSVAWDINDSGVVVGQSTSLAFRWINGAMESLDTESRGSGAFSINNDGHIVGDWHQRDGQVRVFYFDGAAHYLGGLGGLYNTGYGINAFNVAAGTARPTSNFEHVMAFTGLGGLIDLGVFPGRIHSGGNAINDAGEIAGGAEGTAFLYDHGAWRDLGNLGTGFSTGWGINNAGWVVGTSSGRAFIWTAAGGIVDLTAATGIAETGWILQAARAINDSGQIVGYGTFDGKTRAFLLTPVSEATVQGRHLFYNDSQSTGASPSGTQGLDRSIATDKQALLPGQAASFSNYTSTTRGINGVLIDFHNLPLDRVASSDDFEFHVSVGDGSSEWSTAVQPTTVSVLRGAGADGSDRIRLTWADRAVRNTWLRVTARANERTGLAQPDVFYFGNLVGDTGDTGIPARVTARDVLAVRRQLLTKSRVGEMSRFDFNRDGRVNALDLAGARGNLNRTLGPITAAPAPASPFFSAPAANLSSSGSVPHRLWDDLPPDLLFRWPLR